MDMVTLGLIILCVAILCWNAQPNDFDGDDQ